MAKVLIVYSSRFGQCQKIAETIAQEMRDAGSECIVDNLETMDEPTDLLNDYDGIIITASIRYGKFHPKVAQFLSRYHKEIHERFNVFIPVNLVARKPGRRELENNNYVKKFLAETNWQPTMVNIVPGALEYPKYNLIDRWMIQFIMWMGKGETNPKKRVDFTDWAEMKAYGKTLQAAISQKNQ